MEAIEANASVRITGVSQTALLKVVMGSLDLQERMTEILPL